MKKTILSFATAALLWSCAALAPSVYVNNPGPQKVSLQGKSLAILPFEIKYSSSRLALDLRNAKITINGREAIIQNKYIAKDDNNAIGKYGVLDLNILDKEQVSQEAVSQAVTRALLDAAEQKTQYQLMFMRGLGFGEFGWLTSAPMQKNEKTQQLEFTPGYKPQPFFSRVEIVDPADQEKLRGFDYVFRGTFNIDNELVEVTDARPPRFMDDPIVANGEYYLKLVPNFAFSVIDNATGREVIRETDINRSPYPMKVEFYPYRKLPLKPRDGKAYAAFVTSKDIVAFVVDHLKDKMTEYYQLFLPYNVVTTEPAPEK